MKGVIPMTENHSSQLDISANSSSLSPSSLKTHLDEDALRTRIKTEIPTEHLAHTEIQVNAGDLLELLEELKRLRAVDNRLKWLATKPDRTQDVGAWWGHEIDATLAAGDPKHHLFAPQPLMRPTRQLTTQELYKLNDKVSFELQQRDWEPRTEEDYDLLNNLVSEIATIPTPADTLIETFINKHRPDTGRASIQS